MNIFHPILNVTSLAFRLRTSTQQPSSSITTKAPGDQAQNNQIARRERERATRPLDNKGDRDENERGSGMPVEQEHQRVHALIQGHLAHDVHAGVHDPDQDDGGVGLGAATHLGSKQPHFALWLLRALQQPGLL